MGSSSPKLQVAKGTITAVTTHSQTDFTLFCNAQAFPVPKFR